MRIFLTGAKPSFNVHATTSLAERFGKTGSNTGNQVIAYGLLNGLVHDEASWDPTLKPAEVNERFDHVVIAAANFLHSGFDFTYLANFLEQIRLPISIVGLGAQSRDFSADVELTPGTERLVRVLAERCARIGVRGEYTAQLLANRGVTNVQLTGCPSYYADFGHAVPEVLPRLTKRSRVAVNASRDVIRHAFDPRAMRAAVAKLMRLAIHRDAIFVAQTEHEEMVIAEGFIENPGRYLGVLYGLFGRKMERSAFDAWALARCKVFWDVEKWVEAMAAHDFVIGTRFHGAMAGLLAGTPALIVCHDTRTTEMSEFLHIPHVGLDAFNATPVAELHARIDLFDYRARRAVLRDAYAEFLRANGLEYRWRAAPAAGAVLG
ncbi:MAG: polysaccharide pyruvyl transferase family protein [Sphingomonas sp.]